MSVATDTNRQRTLASTAAIQNWGRALAVSGAMSDKASGSIRRLTGAMVANAGTARAMAGATTLASRAFAAMGGPLGLAIMAVTAVAYAIDNAKQKIRDLETAADEATGAFESANSAYDQHTTTIETLNTEIASLIAQEQSLIEDNERLQARIMSLNDRFADLGLYLDATGSSYENLISRVRDLRDAFYEQGDAAAASQLITARGQRAALSQVIGPDGGRLENRLFGGRDNLRELLAFTTGNTNGEYIRQQARQITTDMTPTGAVARSDGEVARGLLEVTGQDDRLSSVNALLTQIAQGGALSANSGQYQQAALELSRIGEDELPGLASALNDFTARVRSYELSIRQEEAAERELAIQNRVGSKTANMTIARAEELRREFETIRREIQSDPELSTDRTAMEAAFLERMGPIEDVLDSYFNGAFQDPESREVARRSGSLGMLEELRGDLRTLFSSLAENAAEAGAARSRISVSEQQFNLRDAQGALRNARDDGEFERARDQVRQTVRALVDQELAQFATNDLGLSPNQFEVRNNQLVPTDLARQSLNTEQQASLVLKNREGAAQVEAAERNIDRAEERRRVDALRTEIDGLRSDISQRKAEQDFLSLENQQMLNEDFGREEAVGALERERELLDEILAKEMEIAELRYRIDNPNATDEQVFAAMAPLRAEQDRQRQLADAETQNEINTLPITNTDDVMGAVMQDNRFTQMDRDATSLAQTLRESMNAAIDSVRQNLGQMFTDIISGTKSAGEAFAQFGTNIISTIAQVMMNKVVEKFTQWIIDTLGAGAGGGGGMAGALMNLGASLFGGGKKSSYQGGIVRANAGRIVRASNGIKTRDAQMIYAQDGEGILRKSAMQSIGEDGFRRLNALGNRALDSGRSIAAMPAGPVPRDTVNVYAVLPEEKPVPGPKDIVAIINDDIRKGGSTKKFIKGVQTGQV
jgi:regulator of replication initiation timing